MDGFTLMTSLLAAATLKGKKRRIKGAPVTPAPPKPKVGRNEKCP